MLKIIHVITRELKMADNKIIKFGFENSCRPHSSAIKAIEKKTK